MSATYNPTSTADLDWVRAQLGDTDVVPEDNALHSDERILFVLEQWPDNRTLAMAQLAQELVTRFAQEPVRTTVQGITVDYSERIKAWSALAAPYVAHLNRLASNISAGKVIPPLSMFGRAPGGRGR